MGEIMKHFDDFEEKAISSLANFANKFTYFGYINKNEKYPVFVDEKKKIYIKAQNPRTFSWNSLIYWNAHSTVMPSDSPLK